MTHRELIKAVAKATDLKPEEAAILWQETATILARQLAGSGKVRIKNFGSFLVVKHKSRTVPDPREMKKKLVIFDQFLPKFRPSEQLKAKVKGISPSAESLAMEVGEEPSVEQVSQELEQAITKAETTGTASGKKAVSVSDEKLSAIIPKNVDIKLVELTNRTVPKEVLNLIPFNVAKKYQMVPIEKKGHHLTLAMIDPGDREAIDLASRQTGLKVQPAITTSADLQYVLDQYGTITSELNELVDEEGALPEKGKEEEGEAGENVDAPAAKIVANILEKAVRDKASDIHIEPDEKSIAVRYRIDGILQKVLEVPKTLQSAIVSRLKIMSNLKIDESRLPQDGRLRMTIDNAEVDFRLSTLPTVNGEKVVMRILDKSAGILGFKELGLDGLSLERMEDNIDKAHGMVLVTGPTGSGKTTTLYAVLGKIMSPNINIVTLEDPVEYRVPGINQSQVNSGIGYDFGSGLRTIVRQDPDVILIGEIRDLETATMAVQSALTGHIVLSTLHTNDAAGAIPRLIDMGIEPFLITSSTNAVIAQRLVRKICQDCKEAVELPEESLGETIDEIKKLPEKYRPKDDTLVFYRGKGCDQCNKSGYKGRMGIYEVLPVNEEIKQLALKRVSASELTKQAIADGMITLKQDGILKALKGETTLEEVWRVTKD